MATELMAKTYRISEKFKSLQGEGLYAGTMMAFMRFVGCSVGKKVCHRCDTDFDKMFNWRGGGQFLPSELLDWAYGFKHICLTGGEPLDQDLKPLLDGGVDEHIFHLETSGTKGWEFTKEQRHRMWICVSPKPGFLEDAVLAADEVKVIVPGLGVGPGWPTLEDAVRWADKYGKLVYLQPQNKTFEIDQMNLTYALDLLHDHPQLRLSVQMHKILKVQ